MDVPMGDLGRFLDEELFAGRDRVTKAQALNAARSRGFDEGVLRAFEQLPDGEFTHDELVARLEAASGGRLRSTFGV